MKSVPCSNIPLTLSSVASPIPISLLEENLNQSDEKEKEGEKQQRKEKKEVNAENQKSSSESRREEANQGGHSCIKVKVNETQDKKKDSERESRDTSYQMKGKQLEIPELTLNKMDSSDSNLSRKSGKEIMKEVSLNSKEINGKESWRTAPLRSKDNMRLVKEM
jgi:hypothetical protein